MSTRKSNPAPPRTSRPPARLSPAGLALFLILLILPAFALWHVAQLHGPRFICTYAVALSLITFLFYRHDKRMAQSGQWRTPETTLHLLELLGGWPGAFLAQRIFRHKNAKTRYQLAFWFIVLLHQYAALDFTQDWRYARKAFHLFYS